MQERYSMVDFKDGQYGVWDATKRAYVKGWEQTRNKRLAEQRARDLNTADAEDRRRRLDGEDT